MNVFVRSRGGPHEVSKAVLRTRAMRMLRGLERHDAELTILLVDDEAMRELNTTWRGKNATTDVLSFPMGEGEYGDVNPELLGDVVISVPTAELQARRSKRTPLEEVTFLLAHGILHLVGYDHGTAAEAREMTKRTKHLMSLGVEGARRRD